MTEQPPVDFTKVETLRRHMLLTTGNMSTLFGVSRMTYHGWVKGKPLRKSNDIVVRRVLRQLLDVMKNHQWPMPEVIASDQRERFSRLQELLNT
jgi:DNA-binding transcriptional regulator YiaG